MIPKILPKLDQHDQSLSEQKDEIISLVTDKVLEVIQSVPVPYDEGESLLEEKEDKEDKSKKSSSKKK